MLWLSSLAPKLEGIVVNGMAFFHRMIKNAGGQAHAYTVDLGSRHEIYKAAEQVLWQITRESNL